MSEQWMPQKGEQFVLAYDGFGRVHTVSKRTKSAGQVFIYDEDNNRHSIEHCYPYNPERPLGDDELKTMIDTCEAIAEAGDAECLVMLEDLTVEQKRQVWAAITPETRQALKELRQHSRVAA